MMLPWPIKPARFGEGLLLRPHRLDTPSAPITTFPPPPTPAVIRADLELTAAQLPNFKVPRFYLAQGIVP